MTNQNPFWKELLAGTFGGISISLVGHPLDLIKVRLQTMPIPKLNEKPLYSSGLDCFRQSIQKEGVLGLYKGVTSPILGAASLYAICFGSYGLGKDLFRNRTTGNISLLGYFNAGCFSGIFTTIVMTPMELIKVKLQLQTNDKIKVYRGAIDCGRKIFSELGFRGIYKGTLSTLMRDVPGTGVYFATYEFFNNKMIPANGSKKDLMFYQTLFAGGMAGIVGWIVMLPPDTIKSRIQADGASKYRGMWHCFRELVREEGYLALYKGIGPVFLRAFPANAACFMGYELAIDAIDFLEKIAR